MNFFPDTAFVATDLVAMLNSPFVDISVVFLVLMSTFCLKKGQHLWLSYSMTAVFVVKCLIVILFNEGSSARIFATIMLVLAAIIKLAVIKKRKHEAATPMVS